jgi:hypothetical protein
MASLRVRVSSGARRELHELEGADIALGRHPSADLSIDHPSVADLHARLLIRRSRLILVDLGTAPKGTRVRGARLQAPIALGARTPFFLGEIKLSAWITSDADGPWIEAVQGFEIRAELDGAERGYRRFLVSDRAGRTGELVVPPKTSPEPSGPGPVVLARGARFGRPFWIEDVPRGVRLEALAEAAMSGKLRLPLEGWVAIVAQVAEAAGALHLAGRAHGSIEPRRIQLGHDGSISLLRPALAAGTIEGDILAIGRIARMLLGPEGRKRADWKPSFDPVLGSLLGRPIDRPKEHLAEAARTLRNLAHEVSLDPSTAHITRLVRLLSAERQTPLARPKATALGARSSVDNAARLDSLDRI